MATLPAGVEIQLLGPAEDSRFGAEDSVSYYWLWPIPLKQGQLFTLHILANGEEHVVGPLDAPNLDSAYRVRVSMGDVIGSSGLLQWKVRLSIIPSLTPLIESETRTITLLPGT
jgi:hypothetical protein